MWLPREEEDADLRQGDIVGPIAFPKLKYPLRVIRWSNADNIPDAGDCLFTYRERHAMVVSQCCEVENGQAVALAPILPTRIAEPVQRQALENYLPPDDPEAPYAYSQFLIEPIARVLVPKQENLTLVADFTQIVSVEATPEALLSSRIAEMNPRARSWLRMKLALFFGRPEQSDIDWLNARDLPIS